MRLVALTLKNFRCFQAETTITFDDLTALIGENDIGKSSILEALAIFFNNATVKVDRDDLTVSARDASVEITCEFSDLPVSLVLDAQAETNLADEFLLTEEGHLRIRKTFNFAGSRPREEVCVVAHHPTAQQYDDLLALTNAALKRRLRDLDIDDSSAQLNSNPSIRHAIWNSCGDLQLDTTSLPVTKQDAKAIWEQLRHYLPTYALFQSDRPSLDSDSEVQDPMKFAVATALAEQDVAEKLLEVTEAVRTKAMELASRTQQTLARISPNLAGELSPDFRSDPKWAGQFSVSLKSEEGIPVNKRGSGFRRLVLPSFFHAEAERKNDGNSNANIIYALEEPETSQHPKNQRMLLESLEELPADGGRQVILTTHSPGFASDLSLTSLRFLDRDDTGNCRITYGTKTTWETIANALGVTPDNRVKILMCVEGPTDVKAIKCLSKALHLADDSLVDLSSDARIAFIPLGGGTLAHWVAEHYLKALLRPEVHIYDNDDASYGEKANQVNQRGDGSWAVQTKKREIENYLYADAIAEALSVRINVSDCGDVPELVSNARRKQLEGQQWNASTVKKKLVNEAFPLMTAERIEERDPEGDVKGWMTRVSEMLQ